MKDSRGDNKLTSTESGRKTLVKHSKVLNDGLLSGMEDEAQIKWHVNTWYPKRVFFNATYFNVISGIRWNIIQAKDGSNQITKFHEHDVIM